jgi:hypothetical protein
VPNIQQPEMRAGGTPGAGGATGPVPPDQQSPYGPQPPQERQPGGSVPAREPDAILIGGLVERYIQTTATREVDGRQLLVYNYDGEVRPT